MKRHPNFKGGSTTEHGYRLIYVGKAHHLADCRGYAYEHRLNAETKLGRRLGKGEVVHHDNESRSDNAPENLIPKRTNGIHLSEHLRKRKDLKPLDAPNPTIQCACGCGKEIKQYDSKNRPKKFAVGHATKNKSRWRDNRKGARNNGRQASV